MAAGRPTVVIAGAGIGGLTAALALAAAGCRVVILEQATVLQEAGAGLQLSPNASRILIRLGLHAPLAASAIVPDAVRVMSGPRGVEISRLPLPRNTDAPYWVIHRAALQAALAAEVAKHPDIELRLGCPFVDVRDEADGVRVTSGPAESRHDDAATALIGADGIWSRVRAALWPDIAPRVSGSIAWRGTVDAERLTGVAPTHEVQLWMGANAHLVVYPISAGTRVNVVAITSGEWNEPGWSAPAADADVQAQFDATRWAAPARAIVGAVSEWRKWALFTVPDGIPWSRGRAALLGDAAHAMLPFAAQGAGMAIEDAAVLASCLAERPDDTPAALAHYAGLRQPRIARVQHTARQNGRIYHLGGPLAAARDLAMRAIGGERLLARQSWIYDWLG